MGKRMLGTFPVGNDEVLGLVFRKTRIYNIISKYLRCTWSLRTKECEIDSTIEELQGVLFLCRVHKRHDWE